jgi:hypothetical protein
MIYGRWSHKLRAILSFIGGGAPALIVWPLLARVRRGPAWASAGAAGLLFLPVFDLAPLVRPVDRVTGFALSFGALYALYRLFAGRRARRWDLWTPWVVSVLAVQAFLYWSVLERLILFLLSPLVFSAAARLERRMTASTRGRVYAATLGATIVLTGALAAVDARYAGAQRDAAEEIAREYPGRRLWCAGHWGFQYYMERVGARQLDAARGGWDEVSPGDVVVVPAVNSNILRPSRRFLSNVRKIEVDEPIPLRLISGFTGEGGFYSSATGFLPYSLSRERLESFDVVEILP